MLLQVCDGAAVSDPAARTGAPLTKERGAWHRRITANRIRQRHSAERFTLRIFCVLAGQVARNDIGNVAEGVELLCGQQIDEAVPNRRQMKRSSLWVPTMSSTSRHQAIFMDEPAEPILPVEP